MDSRHLSIELDFRSGVPLSTQIRDAIRMYVLSGELQPGDQLPTVRRLAAQLGVNWNTVARAYKQLDESGLVSTQHGRGTYVWMLPPAELTAQWRRETLANLAQRFLVEAMRLGCSRQEVEAAIGGQWNTFEAGGSSKADTSLS